LRAPLLLGVLWSFVLGTPGQVLELHLDLARKWSRLWLQALLAVLSLAVPSYFIAHVSRALTRTNDDLNNTPLKNRLRVPSHPNMPIILGPLPLLGCAFGLHRVLQSASTEVLRTAIGTIAAVGFRQGEGRRTPNWRPV
jgi:hypothetical protein